VVPDRLGEAWAAFQSLSARDRREFLAMLRQWHLAHRVDVLAARGLSYRPAASLAGISVGDMPSAFDPNDLRSIGL
jgi:hypothetical protein